MEIEVDRQTQDEAGIRRTLERYMRADDDRSLDGMVSCFAPDAVYRVMGREFQGHDGIRAFLGGSGFEDGLPRWSDPGQLMKPPMSTHVLSNPVMEIDGDSAAVESDFSVFERDEAGHGVIVLLGRYRDRFERQADGRWLIIDRTGVSMARRTEEWRFPKPQRPDTSSAAPT
jgi:ketosteroid isomerase-like protein